MHNKPVKSGTVFPPFLLWLLPQKAQLQNCRLPGRYAIAELNELREPI